MNIHILELRDRLIYCVVFFLSSFFVLFYYSDVIYDIFSIPLLMQLPKGSSLIATQVTSTFLVPFKLSLNLSFLFSFPYFVFHLWCFIAPGLYKSEKALVFPFIFFSIFLFFIGLMFSYYVMSPLALSFFVNSSPVNVSVMTDITSYMDFMFSIMVACGLAFQVPIIIHLLIRLNFVTKEELSYKRSYVFILSFVLGMFLTPPDVVSQVLLAIPIWLLFEIGLLVSK